MIYIFQVGSSGKAVGIDHIQELVDDAIKNVRKDPSLGKLLDSGQLQLVAGDGRKGFESEGPYDAIHVGAAAPTLPQAVSMGFILFGPKEFPIKFDTVDSA